MQKICDIFDATKFPSFKEDYFGIALKVTVFQDSFFFKVFVDKNSQFEYQEIILILNKYS